MSLRRFNLVSGRYPFDGDNIFNLFENISKCQYEMPDDISHDLADLLRGAWQQLLDVFLLEGAKYILSFVCNCEFTQTGTSFDLAGLLRGVLHNHLIHIFFEGA